MITWLKKVALKTCAGKKRFQRFFSMLHRASLIGMNIGTGAEIVHSGELYALYFVAKKFHDRPLVIFDVGALNGEYAKYALEACPPGSEVFAFEPSHQAFTRLRQSLGDTRQAHLFNLALSSTTGTSTLFSSQEKPGLASLYDRRLDHFDKKLDVTEQVNVATVDTFCKEHSIARIHLLKLDIEGNEMNCLKGAKTIIDAGRIDYIQFEFGGGNIDSRTYFQDFFYLLHPRYRIYRILKDGLWEIKHYTEAYEVFMTTNYLAELKQP